MLLTILGIALLVVFVPVAVFALLARRNPPIIVVSWWPPDEVDTTPAPLSQAELDWQADLASKHNEPPWPK